MSEPNQESAAQRIIGDFAPKLVELTDDVLFGDVWARAGEKHWHGATPTTAMTHIAIQEAFDGKAVDWIEQVSDEQYQPR